MKLNVTTPFATNAKNTLAARTLAWLQDQIARLVLSVGLCLVAPWTLAAPAVVLSIAADHSPVTAGEAFSLTVTYDTAMDTSINPVFTFPTADEDPTSFLTATSSSWLNATTFKQNYQAQPITLSTNTVDVAINGAKDAGGTAQQSGLQADVFDVNLYIPPPHIIDMIGEILPDGIRVDPAGSGRVINDADVGKTASFLIRYGLPTDYNGCGNGTLAFMCPNIVFTNTGGTPLSLTNISTIWQTRNRYRVTWTIADGDEQFDSINVIVSGGVGRKDDPTNKNTDTQLIGVFSIDTKNPTVNGLTPSVAAITSAAPASGLFTLTMAYSEAMDTTSTPTLSFPSQSIGTALTPTTGSWTDSTHYAQTFQVSGSGVSFAGVAVKVNGARDAHGNLQSESTTAGVFGINLPAEAPTLASLTPLIVNIPGVNVVPGTLLDANCCGDIFVRVLSRALSTPLTMVGQTASGTVVLDGFQGGRLAFLVTAVTSGDARAEDVYAVGDGRYQVVSNGMAATIVPALVDIGQLASMLPQGSTVQMAINGVLSATFDGLTYVVQPGVGVQRVINAEGRANIAKADDGQLHFTDTAGNKQILYPAFLEPQTLLNYLRAIDGRASLSIQLDGTAKIALQGQTYDVVPDITLSGPPSNLPGQGWLQNGTQHYLFLNQQRANTVQGLGLTTK